MNGRYPPLNGLCFSAICHNAFRWDMSVLKKTSYRHEHVPIVIGLNLGYSWMFDPNDSLVNDAFREERKTTVNETE